MWTVVLLMFVSHAFTETVLLGHVFVSGYTQQNLPSTGMYRAELYFDTELAHFGMASHSLYTLILIHTIIS